MRIFTQPLTALVLAGFVMALTACAQTPSAPPPPSPTQKTSSTASASATQPTPSPQPTSATHAISHMVYVSDFQAVQQGNDSGGLLSRLRTSTHAKSARQNAGLLAHAIVAQLTSAGITAHYLGPDDPRPPTGWLLSGIFYSRDEHHGLFSMFTSQSDTPNVEVSVTIADFAINPNVPFAVIGAQDSIHAQGSVASWNPYVIAAKFVIKKTEAGATVDSLAKDIANQFVGNLTTLQQQDAQAASH